MRDNGAAASIHFSKAEQIAFFHNSREAFLPETSNQELRPKNECDKNAEEARALFEELSAQADENFQKNTGRRTNMKAENKLWESVMNLREHHTLEDVQRVNAKIQKITGFIPVQTSIHRDEGHVDPKTGEFIQNVHAQTLWLTQDVETGKSQAYLLFGRKDIYRKIQDIVASELGMERGKPAEITGAKHFKNMRTYKEVKRAEAAKDKEWEAKLEKNNQEWEAKKAEWEQKQAEREARQAEWEKKLPEIMAARRRNEQFLNDKVDWETLKTANRAFLAWHDISTDLLGYPNPHGNLIIEQAKGSLASIFRLFGTVSQLAIFLLTRTEARELKLKNAMDVYKVSENLQRAVNLVANDVSNDHRKIAEKIQSVFTNLPHDKRQELIELAILHAPNDEIRNDIKSLINGDFHKIARTEQAQKRIENRDLKAALREYSEEIRKIKDELREMDEENRILNLAERALLREKGAGREEYSQQEAQNRKRLEELKQLKDEQKALKKIIDDQKKQSELDAETIAKQAEKIKKLTAQISEITKANVEKQRELEVEKAKRKEAEIITPQMLDAALKQIDELEGLLKEHEEPKPEKQPEPVKIEPKIEPKPEPIKKADDNLHIFGYERPNIEPRRRLEDIEPRKTYDDRRPKYEPEKIEPIREPEKSREEPRDEWQEIEDAIEKWTKCESEVEKNFIKIGILQKLEKYDQNGKFDPEKRAAARRYGFILTYDPIAAEAAECAQKQAERERRERERELEMERKRQAEIETSLKYEEVKKNVRQEDDARQTTIKKKRKDELEMGR